MPGFLYYIPGGASKADLPALGLNHLTDASLSLNPISGGPDSRSGMLMSICHAKYLPDEQTWTQCGKFWLGYETLKKPSTADLSKPEKIQGYTVMLEDGFEVVVPLVRRIPQGTALPETLVIGIDGALITEPLPKYAALSEGAEKIFQTLVMGDNSMSFSDLWNIVCQALAINYRVSPYELSALKVITTINIVNLAEALVDVPAISEAIKAESQKKKHLDAISTPPGEQA